MGQVKPWVQTQGHQACRRINKSGAAEHPQNGMVRVGPDRMNAAREGQHLVKMLPFYPELKLPRDVSGVRTDLERGDDYGSDRPWPRLVSELCRADGSESD